MELYVNDFPGKEGPGPLGPGSLGPPAGHPDHVEGLLGLRVGAVGVAPEVGEGLVGGRLDGVADETAELQRGHDARRALALVDAHQLVEAARLEVLELGLVRGKDAASGQIIVLQEGYCTSYFVIVFASQFLPAAGRSTCPLCSSSFITQMT